jgi:Ca-activated chloride channel family protein
VTFSNPIAVLLLPLVLYAWWVSRHSLADLSAFRRRLAFSLRLLVLLALIFGLAGTQLVFHSTKMCALFVLDLSDSVPPAEKRRAVQFINDSVTEMKAGDTAGVVVFGGDAFVEAPPDESLKLGRIQTVQYAPEFTDIAQAIRLAMAAFDEGRQKRIVLLSDGNENLGRAVEEAAIADAEDVQIDAVKLTPPQGPEVMLDRLALPSEVKIGEPFEANLVATSRQDCVAEVRVWRDGALIRQQTVELVKGKTTLPFTDSIKEPKFATYEAQITTNPESDTLAENNRAMGFTFVRGKPCILYVEGDPGESQYLLNALQAEDITVDVRSRTQIPTEYGDFLKYDAIVLSDVSAFSMSDGQLAMMRANVRDRGIGLIMIGGQESFGAGGYMGTPVEEALPVSMDISNKKFIPAGALVMIMHSIEFPQGDVWARKTAEAVLDTLNEQDKMGILQYGFREQWLFPLQRLTNKSKLRGLIRTMTTGDMPDYASTMKMGIDALAADKESSVRHMILLSDGDASPPGMALINKARAAGITISTVCIGPHTARDSQMMQAIAGWGGGRAYLVNQGSEIPRIFLKEAKVVKKTSIVEEPFIPRRTTEREDILRGIDPKEALPQLLGYVSTTPKPRATVSLISQHDDPVLASWQYGLGRAVAFTSDCKKRWGVYWLEWPKYSKFWAQAVRWAMRKSGQGDYAADVTIDRGVGTVLVDAVDAKGNFINFLDVKGQVTTPSMAGVKVELEQTAPGRYRGEFPAREIGEYHVTLVYKDPKGTMSTQTTGAVVPYSPEFRDLAPNDFLISRVTDITHGRLLKEAREVFGTGRVGAARSQEVWRVLLIIAVCLLPLDIGVRRIMFEKRELLAARDKLSEMTGSIVARRRRRGEAEHEPGLGQLLTRKARVREEYEAEAKGAPEEPGAPPARAAPPMPGAPPPTARVRPTRRDETEVSREATGDMMARLRAAKDRARRQREGRDE